MLVDLIDTKPWSLITVALWEVDVYVLAKVLWVYLSCRRKALTQSCFSGVSTMPPFLSCLMVNVFPGNASFSCCFVTLKSVRGLRLSRIIGVIFLSFLCVFGMLIWCVDCCVVCLVWWLL